ncbi:MAG: secretin N-terminal domain-containing protein [Proteobacteria bacterium]|nr:secretin N-terminal domain-containing protein [Pseudomonadota bacterium]
MRTESRTAFAIVLVIAATACAGPKRAPAPAPASLPTAAPGLEPLSVSIPETNPRPATLRLLEQTRFTLNVQDADLRGLLLGLGRESPLNVVVGPRVGGRVTADLADVSLLAILEQVVLPQGYQYDVQGNLLRVYASDRETRIYRVDYPNYLREGQSDLTISGAIESKASVASGSGGGEDISKSGVQTTQSVDFWTELEAALQSIVLGGSEDEASESSDASLEVRRVLVSRQAGLVTITAPSVVLRQVEHYLSHLARNTGQQVLIDAEIVEVTLNDDLDLGFDIEYAPDLPMGAEGVFERLILSGFPEATIAQKLAPVLSNGGVSIGFARDELGLILKALATQTDVRVLSTPRITTLNNHKALIKVMRNQVFFVAEVESEVVEGVGVTQTTEFVPQIVPIGVTLDVTPHVSDAGEITMHVHPSVSEVVAIENQPAADPTLPAVGSLPVIDLRETDTVVRVDDGQTVVIGGLIQSQEIDVERKVPLLAEIPVLGRLFRSTTKTEKRSELLILLTPTVLEPARILRVTEAASESLHNLESLRSHRMLEPPWWRRPLGRSYGVKR